MANAAGYPHMAEYLASLPHGIRSYPEVQSKASLYRQVLDEIPLRFERPLPDEVRSLIDVPLPRSSWVPEVVYMSFLLALLDEHFEGSPDRFYAWVYEKNRRLYASPLYRMLFSFTTTHALIQRATMRWGQFRKGVPLSIVELGERHARMRMTYPALHYTAFIAGTFSHALEAAICCTQVKRARVELVEWTPTASWFEATWE